VTREATTSRASRTAPATATAPTAPTADRTARRIADLEDRRAQATITGVPRRRGALGARERRLLQQYYLDGANLEALAALHRVTPSAVSRSLAKARATLVGRIRNALIARLRLSGREVDNLLHLVQSQLELSRSMLDEGR